MIHAPVLIPTLNRFDHFKKCLESLSRCEGASKTEVYVGLDYPPSSKYISGNEQIRNYLRSCGNLTFKKLHVIERTKNYGFGLHGNSNELKRLVFKKYDRFILAEDDNVFSLNFLEFMNKALELYKDDPDVNFICGYNYPIDISEFDCNHYFSHEFSAWGFGCWKDKYQKFIKLESRQYLTSIVRSAKAMFKIYSVEPRLINTLIYNYQSGQVYGDTLFVCYQYLTNSLAVFPSISKVRNEGFDGSGSSITKADDKITYQKIDEASTIELKKRLVHNDVKIEKNVKQYFKRPWWMNIAIFVRMLIHAWTGKDIFYYYDIIRHKGVTMIR